jgi:hypothetical protein
MVLKAPISWGCHVCAPAGCPRAPHSGHWRPAWWSLEARHVSTAPHREQDGAGRPVEQAQLGGGPVDGGQRCQQLLHSFVLLRAAGVARVAEDADQAPGADHLWRQQCRCSCERLVGWQAGTMSLLRCADHVRGACGCWQGSAVDNTDWRQHGGAATPQCTIDDVGRWWGVHSVCQRLNSRSPVKMNSPGLVTAMKRHLGRGHIPMRKQASYHIMPRTSLQSDVRHMICNAHGVILLGLTCASCMQALQ